MKLFRWVLLYKSIPGAIVATVIGAACFLLGGYLLLLGVVYNSPRDWAVGRIESMVLYVIFGVVFLGGGIVSLVELSIKQRTARAWMAARVREWAALPDTDPRKKNPPGRWQY